MKTGIELIAEERQEQITKHHRSIEDDVDYNYNAQLSEAASILCLHPKHDLYDSEVAEKAVPFDWNEIDFNKMRSKPYKERLVIAGALIAAEIDRLQAEEKEVTP